jgi:hypothetical protein
MKILCLGFRFPPIDYFYSQRISKALINTYGDQKSVG